MNQEISDDDLLDFLRQNSLFNGCNENQLKSILKLSTVATFNTDDILIQENELCDNIYIIIEGQVGIFKFDDHLDHSHQIATLGPNTVIGEITLLDNAPRSATVKALEMTQAIQLSREKLYATSKSQWDQTAIASKLSQLAEAAKNLITEPPFYPIMVQNIAKELALRVRNTNDTVTEALRKELQQAKAQVAMGLLIVNVVAMLALYMITLKLLNEIHVQVSTTSIVTVPVIIAFTSATFYIILKSGYPLDLYGITLKNWRKSLYEGAMLTVGMIVASIIIKFLFMELVPSYSARSLFDGQIITHLFPLRTEIFILVVYLIFVPLQELVTRGLLQSSFQEFLTGKNKVYISIFLSNLLFSITHFHFPFMVASFVFVTGLVWGWLYSRHHTLVGVTLSHQIFGVWGLFFLGI